MFERFTERARQVVVLAEDEARTLRHNYIGTEHILLGLLREEEGVAARVLKNQDVTVERLRAQLVGSRGELTSGRIPFTACAKEVLELGLREAFGLGHNAIATEHILLGLVRMNEGVAARILVDLDVDPEQIRNEVIRVLSGPEAGPAAEMQQPDRGGAIDRRDPPCTDLLGPVSRPETRFGPEARKALARARRLAASLGHERTVSVHVFAALADGRGPVADILGEHDVTSRAICDVLQRDFGRAATAGGRPAALSDELRRAFEKVPEKSKLLGRKGLFGVEPLLLALLDQRDGYVVAVLERLHVPADDLRKDVLERAQRSSSRRVPFDVGRMSLRVKLATGVSALVFAMGLLNIGAIEVGPVRVEPRASNDQVVAETPRGHAARP